MKERRRFERYNSLVEIKYKTIDGKEEGYCFTKDLSKGGLGVPLNKYISPHKKLIIEMDLAGGEKITAEASVAWSKKNKVPWEALYSAGLEFKKIDPALAEKLANFASAHQWHKNDFEKELEKNEVPLIE